ncbi:MAG: RedB protein [Candidatus Polarisedimenticolia bacterium]
MQRLQGILALWILAVACGFIVLTNYGLKAGAFHPSPPRWPEGTSLSRSSSRPTLVMVAHPHCPCSRASLNELANIMTRGQDLVTAYVLFIKPSGVNEDWTRTDLWESANRLAGVITVLDEGSIEASRFGASTSGHVLLYGNDGRLMFSGGITRARGEQGANIGRDSVLSLILSASDARSQAPVYGCPLFDRRPIERRDS